MRRLVPWFLLPGLVVAAAAGVLIARAGSRDADRTAGLAGDIRRGALLNEVVTTISLEIEDLIGLGAFADVPSELQELADDAAFNELEDDPEGTLAELFDLEASMGPELRELEAFGPVPREVARVMLPLDERIRQRLGDGDQGFIDPSDYVAADRWITDRATDADSRASGATRALADLAAAEPYWRSGEFVLVVLLLVAVAAILAVLGMWRASVAARHLIDSRHRAEADAVRAANVAVSYSERLEMLITLGRRLSTEAEAQDVADTIAAEARAVLAPDVATVLIFREGRLVPLSTLGELRTAAVGLREGVAGRAAESGTTVRTVVPSDPLLPDVAESLSMLAVPMVYDGRVAGVLAVGRLGSELFTADDETVIGFVGLMSAGALRVAERYGSTLALALDDPLTGLGNRRRLDRDLAEIGPQHGEPVSFLMIDIDHFKRFNDDFGHPAGDQLLRSVAATISSAVRQGDIAYRFGGEEFSVLLPHTTATTALAVAERVRLAVAELVPPDGARPVTVSIGVSQGTPATLPSQMIEAADRALYDAKRSGRDRVTMAAAPPSPFAPPSV